MYLKKKNPGKKNLIPGQILYNKNCFRDLTHAPSDHLYSENYCSVRLSQNNLPSFEKLHSLEGHSIYNTLSSVPVVMYEIL